MRQSMHEAAVLEYHPLHPKQARPTTYIGMVSTQAHRTRKLGAARHHVPQCLGRFIVRAPVQSLLSGNSKMCLHVCNHSRRHEPGRRATFGLACIGPCAFIKTCVNAPLPHLSIVPGRAPKDAGQHLVARIHVPLYRPYRTPLGKSIQAHAKHPVAWPAPHGARHTAMHLPARTDMSSCRESQEISDVPICNMVAPFGLMMGPQEAHTH